MSHREKWFVENPDNMGAEKHELYHLHNPIVRFLFNPFGVGE